MLIESRIFKNWIAIRICNFPTISKIIQELGKWYFIKIIWWTSNVLSEKKWPSSRGWIWMFLFCHLRSSGPKARVPLHRIRTESTLRSQPSQVLKVSRISRQRDRPTFPVEVYCPPWRAAVSRIEMPRMQLPQSPLKRRSCCPTLIISPWTLKVDWRRRRAREVQRTARERLYRSLPRRMATGSRRDTNMSLIGSSVWKFEETCAHSKRDGAAVPRSLDLSPFEFQVAAGRGKTREREREQER